LEAINYHRSYLIILAALVSGTVSAEPATNPPKPPNFILMLADASGISASCRNLVRSSGASMSFGAISRVRTITSGPIPVAKSKWPGRSSAITRSPNRFTVLEGGIRVPMFFKWPATLPAGMTKDELVSSLDILPTFITAAGGAIQPSERLTGVDLLPFLTGKREQTPHESLR
jgi:arylsulfatase A-like enzyme